jgi:hypothetical protein
MSIRLTIKISEGQGAPHHGVPKRNHRGLMRCWIGLVGSLANHYTKVESTIVCIK